MARICVTGGWGICSVREQMKLIAKCARDMGHDVDLLPWQQVKKRYEGLIHEDPCYFNPLARFCFMGAKKKEFYTTIEGVLQTPFQVAAIANHRPLIANSRFTQGCLRKSKIKSDIIIPHGIDLKELTAIRQSIVEMDDESSVVKSGKKGVVKGTGTRVKASGKDNVKGSGKKGVEASGKVRFAYMGDCMIRKGLPWLIEALRKLHEKRPDEWSFFMNLWGADMNKYLPLLEKIPEVDLFQKGQGDSLRISHEEVMRELAKCDVYCCTTLSEGFVVPIIEAFGLGLPVISINAPPQNEINSNRTGWLLPWKETDECKYDDWVTHILHLYDTDDLFNVMKSIVDKPGQIKTKAKNALNEGKKYDYKISYRPLINLVT